MSRPSAALQQCLSFRQSLSHTSPNMRNLRGNNRLAPATRLALITARNGTTTTSRRPFHSTQYRPVKFGRDIRPAPALRRKKKESEAGREPAFMASDGVGVLNNKGFYMRELSLDLPTAVERFNQLSESMYDDARISGLLPGISYQTFQDVTIKLFKGIQGPPNPQVIRSISSDVDAVFRIGYLSCAVDKSLTEWVISACALAGARQPITLIQARSVTWTKTTPRTKWTDMVKQFSDEGFPPAMILQAKILGMRGEYQEAFELMEKRVLPYLKPTRRRPNIFQDIAMTDLFESPWRVYALLHASYDAQFDSPESRKKADHATRIAALEYNDRKALVEYASMMMNEKNYDKYEECMCKAAAFGDKNAILYIANFYYQIFHGRYPTTAERVALAKAKAQGQPAPPNAPTPSPDENNTKPTMLTSALGWVSSFFNQSMSREDYRKLALDWYFHGFHKNIPQASFMLALMARETGERLDGSMILDHASAHLENHPEYAKMITELKENWYDPEYVPRLTSRMLAVR